MALLAGIRSHAKNHGGTGGHGEAGINRFPAGCQTDAAASRGCRSQNRDVHRGMGGIRYRHGVDGYVRAEVRSSGALRKMREAAGYCHVQIGLALRSAAGTDRSDYWSAARHAEAIRQRGALSACCKSHVARANRGSGKNGDLNRRAGGRGDCDRPHRNARTEIGGRGALGEMSRAAGDGYREALSLLTSVGRHG